MIDPLRVTCTSAVSRFPFRPVSSLIFSFSRLRPNSPSLSTWCQGVMKVVCFWNALDLCCGMVDLIVKQAVRVNVLYVKGDLQKLD